MRARSGIAVLTATFLLVAPFGSAVVVGQTSGTSAQEKAAGPLRPVVGSPIKCENGKIQVFECQNVEMLSHLPLDAIGGSGQGIILNDIWGWIDSTTGREFAAVGRSDGTAFVEVTDPVNPKYLGMLPLHAGAEVNFWRAIKVYKNHAFIVSESGPHGMQIFDMTQLRDVKSPPAVFQETAHYDGIAAAHSVVVNEETGFIYPTGSNSGGETCGGGLHMVDVHTPTKPTFVGCYAEPKTGSAGTGYIHDAQCVVYRGPDQKYKGREICLNSSETALGIADVTDKKQPKTISITTYPDVGYTHQGWFTEDQRYFFVDDEGDTGAGGIDKTRTLIFDMKDLDDPVVLPPFYGTTSAGDHNLYIRGHLMYQSDYAAGLRIIDITDPKNPKEVGYLDTTNGGEGSWSNYPYFKNNVVAVTSMDEGLFLVRLLAK
jgi:choice-of-anchor B domain-containing protein